MMQQITSFDGTRIGFHCSGMGPPLLLVHGTTADHRRWSTILPQIEGHFTVYAMDRRGRGGSGDTPTYNILREAEDVAAVIEAAFEQGGQPVNLLGHSYGAICSLEAALLTDRVDRLILYEPPFPAIAPPVPPGVPDKIQALVDRGELETALEVFMREIVRMPEHELKVYRQLPMWKARIQLAPTIPRELAFDQSYRFDPRKFANLRTPAMLLLGGDSPTFARQATETIGAALPESRIVIMPGQQHIAMDTNPELFVREVLSFIGK